MRDLIYILGRKFAAAAVVAAAFMCAGCVTDDTTGPDGLGSEYSVTITTRAEDNNGHDAKAPGEDTYNENKIDRVTLFFYPIIDDPTEKDNVPAIYSETIENINKSHTVNLSIKADLREALFGKIDGSARVYAVVNLPKSDKAGETKNAPTIAEDATVNDIRATIVETDFRIKDGTLPEFVMSGEGVIEFSNDMKKAEGRINVARTASKIRIALQVVESVTEADPTEPSEEKKEWKPIVDKARVYITNGVSKAHVGGEPFARSQLSEDDYYKISPMSDSSPHAPRVEGDYGEDSGTDFELRARRVSETSGIEEYPYWHDVPLYSYPHQWETSVFEDRQTYLVIQMPWEPVELGDGEVVIKTFYYQVPINLRGGKASDIDGTEREIEENTLESNMYYLIKLKIGMLGSFNPEDPLKVEADYYVVPWQEETLDAELTDNRYLVVDQQNWVINNEEDLSIPFHTSHKTVIARIKLRFWNFNAPGYINGTTYLTYADDDQPAMTLDYDGKPLRRTIVWENPLIPGAEAKNAIFNESTRQSGESIWDIDVDNTNFNILYHHDMIRWEEYVAGGTKRFVANNNGVTGFYGKDNGRDARNNETGTAYFKKTNPAEMNWSKIEAEITIIHEDRLNNVDNTRFMQTVYITQYPQMYINAERSNVDEDGVQLSGVDGYVFVNGNKTTRDASRIWDHVIAGVSGSTNQNVNMYVISISQLSDPGYIIGDPRQLVVNNNLSDDSMDSATANTTLWTQQQMTYYYQGNELKEHGDRSSVQMTTTIYAPEKSGTVITQGTGWNAVRSKPIVGDLTNYYPADESELKENYVAPKLRIASSFGGIGGQTNKTVARRRCAAYQESGRPAGRWRLPTMAEIKFINELSTKGRIPMLFSRWGAQAVSAGELIYHDNGKTDPFLNFPNYWCAQGAVHIDDVTGNLEYLYQSDLTTRRGLLSNGSYESRANEGPNSATKSGYSAQVAVRCVYDEWYWVDEDGNPDLCDMDTFTWGDKHKQSPQD